MSVPSHRSRAAIQRQLQLCAFVASLAFAPTAFADQEAARDRAPRDGDGSRAVAEQRPAQNAAPPGEPAPDGTTQPADRPIGHLFDLPGVWPSRGDLQLTQFDVAPQLSLGLGVQYRVMYDASNIPGPGGSTVVDTNDYDFFQQRLRLNFGVAPKGVRAGGVVQAEFRGGFGGSSPSVSDPRAAEPALNPFNRLEPRGIRYGYLFAEPVEHHRVLAGILPLSDECGDVLFSADWDFNVGGVALLGTKGAGSYRVGYLRLVDGVGAHDPQLVERKGSLVVGGYVHAFKGASVGAHAYYLSVGKGLPLGATEELWLGSTVRANVGGVALRGFGILNTGDLGIGVLDGSGHVASGFLTGDRHVGGALGLEGARALGRVEGGVQAIFSSGDRDGDVRRRFVTPQGLLGTQGYWAYTHIFSANGPSDVNDLGLEVGNGGAGLFTVQGRLRAPIREWLSAEIEGGWFRSAQPRRGSTQLGTEIGGLLAFRAAKEFHLEVGVARGFLGSFFGTGANDLYEVFARVQFQL